MVTECPGNDSYTAKKDGSGRVSKQNRRFLKRITTFKSVLEAWAKHEEGVQRVAGQDDDVVGLRSLPLANQPTNSLGRIPGDLEPFSNIPGEDQGGLVLVGPVEDRPKRAVKSPD